MIPNALLLSFKSFEDQIVQGWDRFWWVNTPLITLFANVVAVVLTGGGHAPLIFYLPFLLLSGPLLIAGFFVPINDMYWRDRWIGWFNLALVLSPAILSLAYMVMIWLLAPDRRRLMVRGIVYTHVGCAVLFFCYRLFVKP